MLLFGSWFACIEQNRHCGAGRYLLLRMFHILAPHVIYWMRVRVCRVKGTPIKTCIYCQSSTELNEECSRLGLMAFSPSPVNNDIGPILVFHFVLFLCYRGDGNLPQEWVHALGRGGKGYKGSRAEAMVTVRQHSPCFHHYNLSIPLTSILSAEEQENREVTWIPIVSLCPSLLVSTARLASRTSVNLHDC